MAWPSQCVDLSQPRAARSGVQRCHPRGEAGRGRNLQPSPAFASGDKQSAAGSRLNCRKSSAPSESAVPVRNPAPSGDHATRAMPSWRRAGSHSVSAPRCHSEYSYRTAAIRLRRLGAAHLRGAQVGQAAVSDLAGTNGRSPRADGVLDGRGRVGVVRAPQVDGPTPSRDRLASSVLFA